MFKSLSRLISGDPVKKILDEYREEVTQINLLEPKMKALSNEQLQAKTGEFKQRLADGESLDAMLLEAFAVVREVAVRTIGLRHFDVQLIGGMMLHQGKIIEMKTGEGKTLVATMPIYLNALEGQGVHLVTVNDYLARRDARWMGPIFHFLGLSVGVLQEAARTEHGRKAFMYDPEFESIQEDVHNLQMVDRSEAYKADVTYGTNNEFGFDYLRDNMARSLDSRVQRGHHYAILDEVDNILIDEARTPLIISGPSHDDPDTYLQMAKVVRQLNPEDYEANEKDRTVALTEIGEDHVEQLLNTPLRDPDRPEDITPEQARLLGHLEQALRAEHLFKRNKDYVVQSGKVIIVDQFTGRMMAGRRWSDGLHQAVEAKEGVKVRQENVTYATITLQNYFRMYNKLSGMTGTAVTEAEEFDKIYSVDVRPLPTNLEYLAMEPGTDLMEVKFQENGNDFAYYARTDDEQTPVFWRRKDYPDEVYRTFEAKLRAVTLEILRRHLVGQPLLVGTTSVDLSELISSRLQAKSLQTLANILVIRDAYMQTNDIPDDGMRVEALQPLYQSLDVQKQALQRRFARDLDIALNPTNDDNKRRLLQILGLDESYEQNLDATLKKGIAHNVLNAKKHDEESQIIAGAGSLGAVTIATNMAGRGVDIKLGGEIAEEIIAAVNRVLRRTGVDDPETLSMEERLEALESADDEAIGIYDAEVGQLKQFMEDAKKVREVGGLHVLGSERHEARRIDNQLRGRAARQGDPGSSQFFLSLEDELMRLFGGSQVSGLMERLNIDEMVPIAHGIVNRTIESSQQRVEGANFDTRKHLLEYDDVLNQQREVFYSQRNRVFAKDDMGEDLDAMVQTEIEEHIDLALTDPEGPWKLLAWLEETQPTIGLEWDEPLPSYMLKVLLDDLEGIDAAEDLKAELLKIAEQSLALNKEHLIKAVDEQFSRSIERLDDQVRQRVDTAQMAVEAAIMEAEDMERAVDPRQLIKLVEQAAGLRIQMDSDGEQRVAEDPYAFMDNMPDLIEASMGLRIWIGLIQAVERRLGESLDLEPKLIRNVDWDQAESELYAAIERVWENRATGILKDVRTDLNNALRRESKIDFASKVRLLVQMSYGQRSYFDKKTHQRQAVMVARLSYPFYAAKFIEGQDQAELADDIFKHLKAAQNTLEEALGQAEFANLSGTQLEQIEAPIQQAIKSAVGEAQFEALQDQGTLAAFPDEAKETIMAALGNRALTRAYRELFLSVADRLWVDYLTQMEALRTSIGLEAYGQRDPLVQYKSRAFDLFGNLLVAIRSGMVSRMFRLRVAGGRQTASTPPTPAQAQPAAAGKSTSKSRKRRRRRRR